jgi:hypothetical protein
MHQLEGAQAKTSHLDSLQDIAGKPARNSVGFDYRERTFHA